MKKQKSLYLIDRPADDRVAANMAFVTPPLVAGDFRCTITQWPSSRHSARGDLRGPTHVKHLRAFQYFDPTGLEK